MDETCNQGVSHDRLCCNESWSKGDLQGCTSDKDVQVMRGANCWSDHKLVRAKLRVRLPHFSSGREKKLLPFAVHELGSRDRREEYRVVLEQQLESRPHCSGDSAEQNWDVLKSCIVLAAEKSVGRGRRKQPDWYVENKDMLAPLIEAKNCMHMKMLQANTLESRKLGDSRGK